MYTLTSVAQRAGLIGAAVAMAAAVVLPAAAAFADTLNPLTERSLLLSSSAPGWQDTDGSGNSAAAPNSVGQNYAPAGSGPNGKKSGQTFTFTVSSTADIQGFSLQYCTEAAGKCQAPGNNAGDARIAEEEEGAREDNATGHAKQTSDFDLVTDGETPWGEGATAGNYQVLVENAPVAGWTLAAENREDNTHSGAMSGKNNYLKLTNTTGQTINNGDEVKIVFKASETNYITNPGADEFFVKINTYDTAAMTADDIVDGGVTVANVMTDSIHITTKVLETMAFSVGIENPDTQESENHATCEPISQTNTDSGLTNNRLDLGNEDAEFSLETKQAYDVHSYWRLSSNSSGGATVYYSGDTLANTVGDEIADMPEKATSFPGTEQFGLGFVDAGLDAVSTSFQAKLGEEDSRYKKATSYPFVTVTGQKDLVTPDDFTALTAQTASLDYADATGTIGEPGVPATAQFMFKQSSLTIPEPIAQQNDSVISCATAKMRYVANIGADTPAGVYTTKINYLAAPQY